MAALGAVFFFAGCTVSDTMEMVMEAEERSFQRGKQLLREGRKQEALSAFLSVIDKRRGAAPESHLEAGELFRTHLKDPVSAIYHYRKYLELSSKSAQAPHVRQLIQTATKDFAAQLPAHPMEVQLERLDLLEKMERLQKENAELKRDLADLREERERLRLRQVRAPSAVEAPIPSTAVSSPGPNRTAAPSTRTYTVVPGDTLTRISGTVYGTGTRWKDIFEANRDILPNENSLRIGMQLRIPE